MLKLLIVDDEEMICQAIANIIDWKSYNIQLVGTCTDGVEAYHTILDECPDIVITDIRMPGISGLELIERINRTDLCTQFVILSGYGEFEYAKRAMKCGVQHYLLKPCTETQIIDCIQEVTKDYYKVAFAGDLKPEQDSRAFHNLHKTLIRNMIREGISGTQVTDTFFDLYEHYINLTDVPYQFCSVYYLEEKNLARCLERFDDYCRKNMPEVERYAVYIQNVLLVFFPNFETSYVQLDSFFKSLDFPGQTVSVEYSRMRYTDLKTLLTVLIKKLKRYDILDFIDGTDAVPNFNYGQIVDRVNRLVPVLADKNAMGREDTVAELKKILSAISNKDFLLQLCDNIIISLGTQLPSHTLPEITDFLYQLHKEEDAVSIADAVLDHINKLSEVQSFNTKQYSPFISRLIDYIYEHYSNPDLTLKWISENYLYMNVNYVSRCFTKETGEKFSGFLMKLRVQKAKEILSTRDNEQIQNVAQLVGCGNTPYYFSKIFKKCTGLTPSAYVKKMSK